MINTNYNSSFPDQVVPEAEKATQEYGLAVARAIENEWFQNDRGVYDRFNTNYNNFHRLRLYARGEQSVQKYKDELSINGDWNKSKKLRINSLRSRSYFNASED